jgi:hypothetical protein
MPVIDGYVPFAAVGTSSAAMVKVDLFDIVFVNKHNVFEAGQLLKGFIIVELAQAIKVENLRLKIKGKAQTQWSTHRGTYLF